MKKVLFAALFFISQLAIYAQANPTLAVGLETLTMNKGTIDVKVLTEIIVQKQKELKQEALKRFMLKLFPDANYTTKFYIQNSLHILLNEKNPQVIEKELLELTTNYALALGVTYALIKSQDPEIMNLNNAYTAFKWESDYYREEFLADYEKRLAQKKTINGLEKERNSYKAAVTRTLALEKARNFELTDKEYKQLLSDQKHLKKYEKKLARYSLKKGYTETAQDVEKNGLTIPFGVILDVVSLSLSEIEELQKAGFFKIRIDYRSGEFYQKLSGEEGVKFKDGLEKLRKHVCVKIKPYVENYDIIKEYLAKTNTDKIENILQNLKDESVREIVPIIEHNVNARWLNSIAQWDEVEPIIRQIEAKGRSIGIIKNSESELSKSPEIILPSDFASASEKMLLIDRLNERAKLLNGFSENLYAANIIDAATFNRLKIDALPVSYANSLSALRVNVTVNPVNAAEQQLIQQKVTGLSQLKDSIFSDRNTEVKYAKYKKLILQSASLESELKQEQLVNLGRSVTSNLSDLSKPDFIAANFADYLQNIKARQQDMAEVLKDNRERIAETLRELKQSKTNLYSKLSLSKEFYEGFLDDFINSIINQKYNIQQSDSLTNNNFSVFMPQVYNKVKSLIHNENIKLADIQYLEEQVIPKMIEFRLRDRNADNDKAYLSIIEKVNIIIPLLKIKALYRVNDLGDYSSDLLNLFEFISNLNKLDKAETYQSVINMLRDGSKKVENNLKEGTFKDTYILFINGIKKYTLINPSQEYVEVDIVSFLNELQQYYGRNSKSYFGLYLTLGLDQNFFLNDFSFPDSQEKIKNISFASEKIGLKIRFHSFKDYGGYENAIKNDVYLNKKAPFVNEFYGILYGSGLLYSLANTVTNENFDFPHAGFGAGIRFYNALDLNFTMGFPFIKDRNFGKDIFLGIGLDIPLGEYLEKLGREK